jgi:hypothetical protein
VRLTPRFSTVRIAVSESKVDEQGGLVPIDEERAKEADFVTLPEGVNGTNCGNCLFIREIEGRRQKYCVHPKIDMPVNNRNCCKWWDAYGTGRHFDFTQTEEILSGSEVATEISTTSSRR